MSQTISEQFLDQFLTDTYNVAEVEVAKNSEEETLVYLEHMSGGDILGIRIGFMNLTYQDKFMVKMTTQSQG